MNVEDFKEEAFTLEELSLTDKWILTKLNKVVKEITKNMEKYEFHNAGNALYSFIWEDFCDNYIEFAKSSLTSNTTKSVLLTTL